MITGCKPGRVDGFCRCRRIDCSHTIFHCLPSLQVWVVTVSLHSPRWMVVNHGFPIKEINNDGPVQFFLYGVTIVVVAVPEGLPLAVTISLAYR